MQPVLVFLDALTYCAKKNYQMQEVVTFLHIEDTVISQPLLLPSHCQSIFQTC